MSDQIVIERRFRGPSGSGNGGYTCGRVAAFASGPAEVTLRLPPPLDRPLAVEHEGVVVRVLDGGSVVAEGKPASVELDVPDPPSFEQAGAAALPEGDLDSPFPECFVCGAHRSAGDGLRIFAGPLGEGMVAATWVPAESHEAPEFVWAALDCPGAYAGGFGVGERGTLVLGRFAARVDAVPCAGERCVVVGWPLGEEGRKVYAGTALYGEGGRLLGIARATWIQPLSLAGTAGV
jgi:hypothetical protein